MAMNVGPSEGGEDEAISAINTTPLVDVMLVLLIIFLITIPVVTQSVGVKLPEETNIPRQTKPENIEIAVTKDGDVYWGMQLVKDNDELVGRLKKIATSSRNPRCTSAATSPVVTNSWAASCSPASARGYRRRLRD